jgi:hypothetical protein
MELARLTDEDGDMHSITIVGSGRAVLRVAHSDDDTSEAGRILASEALELIDSAGLNTTANELRAKLAEATSQVGFWKARHADDSAGLAFQLGRNLEFAQEAAYRCGATEPHTTIRSIQIVEEKVAELTAQLANARQTIAHLRQSETVRPAANEGEL